MVEYLIGNYLVESGKITKEQLEAVLKKQDTTRVKLGVIAVAEGMMTAETAEAVNRLQIVMDKRFGDIAIEKKYLTEEQIAKLLKKQGNAYLMFVQTLMDEGLMDINEINAAVDEFRKTRGYNNSEIEDIKSDDIERIVPVLIPEETENLAEVISIALRTIVRFVDRHIFVKNAVVKDSGEIETDTLVSQRLEGDEGVWCGMHEVSGGLLEICSKFGQEEFDKIDMDSLDAGGEMLNCTNGLYVSSLSRNGKFLELMPPEYGEIPAEIKNGKVLALEVSVSGKDFIFIVGNLA